MFSFLCLALEGIVNPFRTHERTILNRSVHLSDFCQLSGREERWGESESLDPLRDLGRLTPITSDQDCGLLGCTIHHCLSHACVLPSMA